jgi:DNA-binding HxlR family transcriptional regulator
MSDENNHRWRTESLDLIILDLLVKRQGTLKEDELMEMLRAMIKDLSGSMLNRELMDLELRGKINVSTMKKGRVITLVRPKGSPAV